ncbi:PREDICTED: phosphatidate cytidylyltransferase, mitochondrial isoform X2 [Chinchilla lanigera]|uniref:phosphatidate cytidylyltransferase, mitochondrial isoform X2 n=1 Tax=Chinchilla lanigera TaxID=34839 RepID=UPI00038EAC53|nr:PREDICTED: phosphatidate cytidylyltransferase, mitochondrial isoform X2 [Chinchilla lanigera]
MALQSSGVAFRRILSHFPEELSLAFAYGSGVYRQAGPSSDQKNAMLDFVFTVDDPVAWHSKNLKKNWSHYSFLKLLGPKMITSVQNNYGARVYYNPLILCDGRLIKYGVISTRALIEDLLGWNNLYIAGRLQKPVKIVAMNEDVTLRSALDKNLRSAVTAAFLMLPESFSEEELFVEIAGLSYAVAEWAIVTLTQGLSQVGSPCPRGSYPDDVLCARSRTPSCAQLLSPVSRSGSVLGTERRAARTLLLASSVFLWSPSASKPHGLCTLLEATAVTRAPPQQCVPLLYQPSA